MMHCLAILYKGYKHEMSEALLIFRLMLAAEVVVELNQCLCNRESVHGGTERQCFCATCPSSDSRRLACFLQCHIGVDIGWLVWFSVIKGLLNDNIVKSV